MAKWTDEDVVRLIELVKDGYGSPYISEKLCRGTGAIRAKCSEIGLTIVNTKKDEEQVEKKHKVDQLKDVSEELQKYKKKAEIAGWIDDVKIKNFTVKKKSKKREAVAVGQASDWHIDEIVKKEAVSGLNEFNRKIMLSRAEAFFHNFTTLINQEKQFVNIPQIILILGGDFLSGFIHEELRRHNIISPVEAIAILEDIMEEGINYILRNTTQEKITIPCVVGNHGRIGEKMTHKGLVSENYEFLLYRRLEKIFSNEKRIEFILPDGYFIYLDIYDLTIRVHHGNAIRYRDGVGGPTIPINKKIARWDVGRRADIDYFHHLHTRMHFKKFIANGSLIGYTEYAHNEGFPFEPAEQQFSLIDSDYGGITKVSPIFLD